MVVIAGLFFDGTAVTMIGAIAFCATLALMITLRTLGIMERSNNLN
jgi:DHA1 family bicyclomycin/chloramphenicol resistance-like MFS transporter